MRSRVVALLAVAVVSGCGNPAAPLPLLTGADVIPGEIVVDFKDGTTKAQIDVEEKAWGIDLELNSVEGTVDGVALSRGALPVDIAALLAKIRLDADVEYAEPLYRYHADFVPNDPRFKEQWNLQAIHAPEAWDVATGKGVIVAVIDTGIAYENHGGFKLVKDLEGHSFAKGWNFVADNEHANDDQGHGTHVAGTIAQVTNNNEGVAGIAFDATLMPLKVLDESGVGNSADIADAIRWAADHGANVINMSLGGGPRSQVMEDAIRHARNKGVVVVAAAGNNGARCGSDCKVEFPAAYPGVIAVSAVGPSGELAPYSSWGDEVGIAAPGGDKSKGDGGGILQATVDGYDWYQGTSMATPHVAGVAALLLSAGASSPDEVADAIYEGAQKKDDARKYGHGLLDAAGALKALGAVGWTMLLWRAAAALVLAVFLGKSLSRRSVGFRILSPTFLVGVVAALTGFFFLRRFGLASIPVAGRVLGLATHPVPDWGRTFVGGAPSPLAYSVLIPVVLTFLTLPFKPLHKLAAGIAFGFSAFMLHVAISGTPEMSWIHSAMLAKGWLAVNAAIAWGLARQVLVFTPAERA